MKEKIKYSSDAVVLNKFARFFIQSGMTMDQFHYKYRIHMNRIKNMIQYTSGEIPLYTVSEPFYSHLCDVLGLEKYIEFEASKQQYASENSYYVDEFVEKCCEFGKSYTERGTDFYSCYVRYLLSIDSPYILGRNRFFSEFSEKYPDIKLPNPNNMAFKGVRLKRSILKKYRVAPKWKITFHPMKECFNEFASLYLEFDPDYNARLHDIHGAYVGICKELKCPFYDSGKFSEYLNEYVDNISAHIERRNLVTSKNRRKEKNDSEMVMFGVRLKGSANCVPSDYRKK